MSTIADIQRVHDKFCEVSVSQSTDDSTWNIAVRRYKHGLRVICQQMADELDINLEGFSALDDKTELTPSTQIKFDAWRKSFGRICERFPYLKIPG